MSKNSDIPPQPDRKTLFQKAGARFGLTAEEIEAAQHMPDLKAAPLGKGQPGTYSERRSRLARGIADASPATPTNAKITQTSYYGNDKDGFSQGQLTRLETPLQGHTAAILGNKSCKTEHGLTLGDVRKVVPVDNPNARPIYVLLTDTGADHGKKRCLDLNVKVAQHPDIAIADAQGRPTKGTTDVRLEYAPKVANAYYAVQAALGNPVPKSIGPEVELAAAEFQKALGNYKPSDMPPPVKGGKASTAITR